MTVSARDDGRRTPLLFGGAGFVGTCLAARLLGSGQSVTLFDDLSRAGSEHNFNRLRERFGSAVRLIRGDVRDLDAVAAAVQRASAVFHFAAQVAVTTSFDDPRRDFDVNIGGTFHVLEALRRCAVPPPLLYTSTNKVYGALDDVPLGASALRHEPIDAALRQQGIGESRPLDLMTPYGCSKGAADQYVLDYARSFDLRTVVFRMSCIYGPNQNGNVDQGWVAHIVRRHLAGETVEIFGDGRQVRDLLFADDLVAALVCALAAIDTLRGRAFNIGGGPENACSLLELLAHLRALAGRDVPTRFCAWRPGDQRWYVSDTAAFRRATGWRPRVSVRDGITRLHRWLQQPSANALSARAES